MTKSFKQLCRYLRSVEYRVKLIYLEHPETMYRDKLLKELLIDKFYSEDSDATKSVNGASVRRSGRKWRERWGVKRSEDLQRAYQKIFAKG